MKQKNHPENCGCCEGVEQLTPMFIANRPGLNVLAYRVGTYASFLETMQARLSTLCLGDAKACQDGEGQYPLKSLTTRDEDDPAIALLHAWANVADVLTFYQERIANEGYLQTATERRSILELARLVGYKLRPGVAATAYLAFEMEKDSEEEIPAGTRAKSTPGPNELPQAFETSEALPGRYEWNALRPRFKRPQYIVPDNAELIDTLYFEDVATNLKPNDPLLLIFGEGENAVANFRMVESVTADPIEDLTTVTLQEIDMKQAFVNAVEAIRQTLEKHQNLEAFGVSESTQMAGRVMSSLRRFTGKLGANQTFEDLKASLAEELPPLREEQAIAEEGDYSKLGPWITGLVAELDQYEYDLNRTGLPSGRGKVSGLSGGGGGGGGGSRENGTPPLAPLVGLVTPLLLPPSEQPPDARHLRREVKTIFDPTSDTVPRLLTRFKPKLQDTLYDAWANAEFTDPPALDNVQAPRVKASPFGHNAPLKPIFDEEGKLIGQEEWPLTGSVAFRVDLTSTTTYRDILSGFEAGRLIADIAVVLGSEQLKARLALEEPSITLPLDGVTVDITVDMDSQESPITNVTFKFTGSFEIGGVAHPVNKILSIEPDEEFIILSITIDENPDSTRSIEPGYKVSFPFNNSKVTLSFENSDEFFVLDESLIPPVALNVVALDSEYNQITPGSWVAIKRAGRVEIFQVQSADTISLAAYGISGKVTQLTLYGNWLTPDDLLLSALRQTVIYAQGEKLIVAEEPINDDVAGDKVELDALYDGLEAGRWVIVSGERTDIGSNSSVLASELMMLAAVTQGVSQIEVDNGYFKDLPGDKTHTTIHFPNKLAYTYKRKTVVIHGNVAHATHGETVHEVLGGGDGSQVFQTFMLKQSPLTFLAAPTPAGAETTLEVRVNEVRWHEADNLFELERQDRGYITRTDNDAKTAVTFGDGRHGARLPTGAENIKAVYRFGIGKPGNVSAEQINQLATRPLGVKGVINPLATSGGADRESRDQARQNVPLAVMSLDRLVSLPDYADFARTFAGIGKASATRLSDGQRELVHLTIAGADDVPIETNSDLYRNLCQALHLQGDPYQPIRVELRELIVLVISANVRLLPDYQWISVEPEIRAALLGAFSFTRRRLGQDALLSEAISAIQHTRGVAYVDVDLLDGIPEAVVEDAGLLMEKLDELANSTGQPKQRVVAQLARSETSQIRPAQLAILVPDLSETVTLTELTR